MVFISFTLTTIAVLFAPLLPPAPLLEGAQPVSLEARTFILACYAAFGLSYALSASGAPARRAAARAYNCGGSGPVLVVRPAYLLLLVGWSAIGAAVSILQIHTSVGFATYASMLDVGGRMAEDARGATVGLEGSIGGLPGWIKMWNQNCTASLLIVLNLVMARRKLPQRWGPLCVGLLISLFIVRNFLYLDRLSLLVLVPPIAEVWRHGRKRTRRWILAGAGAVLILAQVQSLRRGYGFGALEFLVLYVQSGAINLTLMIDSLEGGHTYGLVTVLSPIYFAAKAFGVRLYDTSPHFLWVWNHAQDAYGTLFQDFGWFAPCTFLPFGFLARWADLGSARTRGSSLKGAATRERVKLLLGYAALSMMFVPAYQGPEFYLTLAAVLAATSAEYRRPRLCFLPLPAARASKPGRPAPRPRWSYPTGQPLTP